MVLVVMVALSRGRTPNSLIMGCHFFEKKNSFRFTSGFPKKRNDSLARILTIPIVINIEITALIKRRPETAISTGRFFLCS
jgi:hypothetical protein